MNFDVFVLPFSMGLIFLLTFLIYKFTVWIKKIVPEGKNKIFKAIFSLKMLSAIKEIFLEGLLHRKIFKQNILHGYMHACFALGWFLLIVIGNIESRLHGGAKLNPPYYPIFLKFFEHHSSNIPYTTFFRTSMDLILLLIILAIVLAIFKRIKSTIFGIKKRGHRKLIDKLSLTTLWLIFPLRLLAESFTAGMYGNGGFMTNTLGHFFANHIPLQAASYLAWWAYSCALGIFFVVLPFSRYMHIPTEILLIVLRKFGVEQTYQYDTYSEVQVNACPRCGLCMDTCQLHSAAQISNVQSVYFLRSIRDHAVKRDETFNCLMCGRCQEKCPVGINTNLLRLSQRTKFLPRGTKNYEYLKESDGASTDVLYFAGCMSQLTPSIKKSVSSILKKAGVNYALMDENGGLCCGRPLMLTGDIASAQKMIELNRLTIQRSGAKILLTSCPICYKVFKDDYHLDIEVLHHTEYINRLVSSELIKPQALDLNVVYHDPCELGRASGIYEEPRLLIRQLSRLEEAKQTKANAVCCGGSIANSEISSLKKDLITKDALKTLTQNRPDLIVTACPLCKKTFVKHADVEILDIAELVSLSINSIKPDLTKYKSIY